MRCALACGACSRSLATLFAAQGEASLLTPVRLYCHTRQWPFRACLHARLLHSRPHGCSEADHSKITRCQRFKDSGWTQALQHKIEKAKFISSACPCLLVAYTHLYTYVSRCPCNKPATATGKVGLPARPWASCCIKQSRRKVLY